MHDPQAPTQLTQGAIPRRPGLVLVVDAEPLVGEMIHRALATHGFEPIVASSPEEAIEIARRHPIALLVTDLMMPGMTGIELASQLRSLHGRVPVILMSGTPDAAALAIDPPSTFIAKPFALAALASAAASLIASS